MPNCVAKMKRTEGKKSRSEAPLYQQDRHIPHLMNRAAAAMYAAFSDQFPLGMSVPMWRVLAILYERGEQRQVDLSRLTFAEPSTISRMISALKRKNLVSRTPSETSNREVTVRLTTRGRTVVANFIPIALEHESIMTQGLNDRDVLVLRRCLTQIHLNMQARIGNGRIALRGKSPVA